MVRETAHRFDWVVIGAGITGLTAAYTLAKTHPRGCLLEASGRVGGKIDTVRDGPFLVELGPDAMVTVKPEAIRLCREIGLEEDLIAARPLPAYLIRKGRWYPIPRHLFTFEPHRLNPLRDLPWLSLRGRLRVLGYPLLHRMDRERTDRSVADAFTHWTGVEFTEWVVEPLLTGIYGGPIEALSLRATMPHLVSTAAPRKRRVRAARRSTGASSVFRSLRNGLAQLADRLADRIRTRGAHIWIGRPIVRITRDAECYTVDTADGTSISARTVIVTIPPGLAATVVRTLDPELAGLLQQARTTPVAVVAYAFRGTAPDLGSGFLIPRRERRWITACTWLSRKWPGRCPPEWHLVRVFLTGTTVPSWMDLSDASIVQVVWEELTERLGFQAQPERVWIRRWPDGMTVYRVGHLEWLQQVESRVTDHHPGLFLAGAGYGGIGLADCVRMGTDTATRALAWLRCRRETSVDE